MISEQIKFVDNVIVEQISSMQSSGLYLHSFILIAQAIEVMGGLLDQKPVKATSQSMKRFSKGLNLFMGAKYRVHNQDHNLYKIFRSQLAHSFIPSSRLHLTTKKSGLDHLSTSDGKLVFVAEDLLNDLICGVERFKKMLTAGEIRPKAISSSWQINS